MPDRGEAGPLESAPAENAARCLFEQGKSDWLQLEGPSKEVSKALWKLWDTDPRDQEMLEVAIRAGYATKLAEGDGSAAPIPPASKPGKTLAELLRSGLTADERFFAELFPLGRTTWEAMLESWDEEISPWLMYEGGGRTLDPALKEEAFRIGYVTAAVDRAHGLEPRRITDPRSPLYGFGVLLAIFLYIVAIPIRIVRVSLIVCIAAALNLPSGEPLQIVAVAAAGLNLLARLGFLKGHRWLEEHGFEDLEGALLLVPLATGLLGAILFAYSLF